MCKCATADLRMTRHSIRQYEKIGDMLANAQELAKRFPQTYQAPDDEELALVEANNCEGVKILHELAGERFWITVVNVKDGMVYGTVANNLVCLNWPFGKKVCFPIECVYDTES